jgi:hypothetical protein
MDSLLIGLEYFIHAPIPGHFQSIRMEWTHISLKSFFCAMISAFSIKALPIPILTLAF